MLEIEEVYLWIATEGPDLRIEYQGGIAVIAPMLEIEVVYLWIATEGPKGPNLRIATEGHILEIVEI